MRIPGLEVSYDQVRELMDLNGLHTPFLILSRETVRQNLEKLSKALPGVGIHYAIKANSHPAILEEVAKAGHSFDIASYEELRMAHAAGGRVSDFIHSHPIKSIPEIKMALDAGVEIFVADNPDEIEKFRDFGRKVRIMLRLKIEDSSALVNLSYKFGCMPKDIIPLAIKVLEVGQEFGGLEFHVGSQCVDNGIYLFAVETVGGLIRELEDKGIPVPMLDIGGGFPAPYVKEVPGIDEFCAPIMEAIGRHIPANIKLACEPGRFVSATAVNLVTRVIGKSMRAGKQWYYLDDGLYGSFSGKVYDHMSYLPITGNGSNGHPYKRSVLAGPTCDSVDVIFKEISLPRLEIGDLLIFPAMGAYCSVSASSFNCLRKAEYIVID